MSARQLGLAMAIVAALSAGCSQTEGIERGGSVIGETLTVYSLLPDPGEGRARDIVDGERLALRQADGRAGRFKVNFASLDETGGAARDEVAGRVASATRQAIADAQIIAVIGDLDGSTAAVSVPLLNSAGILHVSPGVTYPGFTAPAAPGEPDRFYPAGRRTFFPMAPDDAAQARALAGTLRGRVLVEQEAGEGGAQFGSALRAALGASRLVADPARADAAVYAGTDLETARGVVASLRRENPRMTIFVSDELARELGGGGRVVGLAAEPPLDAGFARAFEDAFGREPGPAAATGHRAMGAVLAAVARAGTRANRRDAVIAAYRSAPAPPPALVLVTRRGREVTSRPLG